MQRQNQIALTSSRVPLLKCAQCLPCKEKDWGGAVQDRRTQTRSISKPFNVLVTHVYQLYIFLINESNQ